MSKTTPRVRISIGIHESNLMPSHTENFFPPYKYSGSIWCNMRLDDIENDYRLGTMTNVYIGKRNDVSEAYVRKVAKKYGWVKGEPRKVKPPLPEVYKDVIKKPLSETISTKKNDEHAFMLMDLLERMLDELHQITTYQGDLKALILAETENDRDSKRRAAMLKAISLPIRTHTLKTITQILINTKRIGSSNAQLCGKKEQNAEKAKVAIKGRFAPSEPPKLSTVK